MANLRQGIYGNYYGSYFSESEPLSTAEMQTNAFYIYSYLSGAGWTDNAIAGILGNMQAESSLNPGRWQSENVGNYSGGYGLVQWTPATNYTDWCNSKGYADPSEMDNNLNRIIYELEHGLQWIATVDYPLSFADFTKSTLSPSILASAFLKNYERAGVEVESTRQQNANNWYTFLTGLEPGDPIEPEQPTAKKKHKYNFILFNRQRKVYQNGIKRNYR